MASRSWLSGQEGVLQTFMHSFFSEASAKGARSTALHALQWVIGMVLVAMTLMHFAGAPFWLLVTLILILGVFLLVFLGAYIYLLIRNPDALRSEQFTLSKIALEKGLVGDSVHGLFEYEKTISAKSQPSLITDQGGED